MLLPLIIVLGAAAGAAGMIAPTYLKVRFGADEVVTTLLLNFIILIFLQMMLEGPLQDPMGLGWPQSAPSSAARATDLGPSPRPDGCARATGRAS